MTEDEQTTSENTIQVPNCNFATDNEHGIACLLPSLQGDYIDQPVRVARAWNGKPSRHQSFVGTWHFYLEDYAFQGLWKNPVGPLQTPAPSLVEANFSLDKDTPNWLALYHIGRKRWLSRFWQSHGRRIFVDLNVPGSHAGNNLIGVPKGWRAYACRGNSNQMNGLHERYEIACTHAGTTEITMLVYSGGEKVQGFCREKGLEYSHNEMDIVRGRVKSGA